MSGRRAQKKPTSVVILVSDGTGINHYAWLLDTPRGRRVFKRFTRSSFVRTSTLCKKKGKARKKPGAASRCLSTELTCVTESAAAATAMATGKLVPHGSVSMGFSSGTKGKKLVAHKTLMEIAAANGMRTGAVVTSEHCDATPAAFFAHAADRSDMRNISEQMLLKSPADLILGGGRKWTSKRVLKRFETDRGGAYFTHWSSRNRCCAGRKKNGPLVGLLAKEGLARAPGRSPSTPEMVSFALKRLERQADGGAGFCLLVEESQVDWAGHQGDERYAACELRSLLDTVETVQGYAKAHPDTLFVLTSDHDTGGMLIRGNRDDDEDADEDEQSASPRFYANRHVGSLVPLWAMGPGSETFPPLMDNTDVFRILSALVTRTTTSGGGS